MAEDKSSKTEKPTSQRRKQARDEGNIPRTPDLSAWLTVLAFVIVGPISVDWLRDLFVELTAQIDDIAAHPQLEVVGTITRTALLGSLRVVAPVLLTAMLVGTAGHVVQGGLKISSKRFKPQWRKLNPITGIKQQFSMHAAWTFAKTLIKFIVFGWVAYDVLRGTMDHLIGSGTWSLGSLADVSTAAVFDLLKTVAMTGLVIAMADWFMERLRVEKTLKMSKDEIRRENKQSEGDPHVRAAVRARQREMGRKRMMAAVGTASVVVVNPTHVSVALTYTPGGGAPQVVAKGTGYLAQRIREEAEAHGVPLVRDPIVARTIYKLCDIGQFIPAELYDAIAQVLAFVFKLNERGKGSGTHDSPLRHGFAEGELPEELSDEALGFRRGAQAA